MPSVCSKTCPPNIANMLSIKNSSMLMISVSENFFVEFYDAIHYFFIFLCQSKFPIIGLLKCHFLHIHTYDLLINLLIPMNFNNQSINHQKDIWYYLCNSIKIVMTRAKGINYFLFHWSINDSLYDNDKCIHVCLAPPSTIF